MPYIYEIKNKSSGKSYIGCTKRPDVNDRWKGHIHSIKYTEGGCPAIKSALKKYGVDNFIFRVVCVCFEEDMYEYEKHYIKKFNSIAPNGYNISEGGECGNNSEAFCNLMKSIDIKGRMEKSEKWKKAIEEGRVGWKKGDKHTEETKKKIREGLRKYYSNKRKLPTPLQERKLMRLEDKPKPNKSIEEINKHRSESLKKYYRNKVGNKINIEKHRKSMAKSVGVKVEQYDLEGNLLNTYESIREAARQCNISKGTIRNRLKKGFIEGNKFIWKRV